MGKSKDNLIREEAEELRGYLTRTCGKYGVKTRMLDPSGAKSRAQTMWLNNRMSHERTLTRVNARELLERLLWVVPLDRQDRDEWAMRMHKVSLSAAKPTALVPVGQSKVLARSLVAFLLDRGSIGKKGRVTIEPVLVDFFLRFELFWKIPLGEELSKMLTKWAGDHWEALLMPVDPAIRKIAAELESAIIARSKV